jgi:glutaredoxin-like protein NrdH
MRTIKVFTEQFCPACTMTKDYLAHHQIAAQLIDVTTDHAASAALKQLGYNSLPLVLVDEDGQMRVWTGYRPDLLATLS